jgi:predicted RNA-binding protein YlxR (DUF448 family)
VTHVAPIRTCVGCGVRDAQAALRRFVLDRHTLRLDGARRAPGRGAYLHPRTACGEAFLRRRGAIRSLRQTPERRERERLVQALREASTPEVAR